MKKKKNLKSCSNKVLELTQEKRFLEAYELLFQGISKAFESKSQNDIIFLVRLINGVGFFLSQEYGVKKEQQTNKENFCQFCFKEKGPKQLLYGADTSICKDCAKIAVEALTS